jgi:hypothetical protein
MMDNAARNGRILWGAESTIANIRVPKGLKSPV